MTRTSRLALVALSALAACTVNPDNIKPTAEDLCRAGRNALSDRIEACFGTASAYADFLLEEYSFFGYNPNFYCPEWGESVSAGRTAFDESAGAQCISDIGSMTCADLQPFLNQIEPLPGACGQAFRGRVPTGSPCVISEDCAAGSYCQLSSTCGGTCTAYVSAGQTCYTATPYFSARCSPGLNCITISSTGTCVSPITAGNSCPGGWGCADGLYCDWVTTSTTYHTCQPDVPQNGSCVTYPCAQGLYCDGNTGSSTYQTCQPQKKSGSCGQWNACLQPFYACSGPSVSYTTPGTCQPDWAGQPCQNGYGGCIYGTYCNTGSTPPASGVPGTCTVFPGVGGTCGSYGAEGVSCRYSSCNIPSGSTGTCTAYLPLGSACSSTGAWDQCGYTASCTNTSSGYVCTALCP